VASPIKVGVQIIADAICLEAKFLGAVHQMKHFRAAQHGFGRDAAPVQTNAAHVFAFNNRDIQP